MESGERGDRRASAPMSRRGLVVVLTGLAGVGLAGCSRVTEYEFQADEVEIPEGERGEVAYGERNRTSWTAERSRTVRGVEIEASIESHVTVYEAIDEVTPPVIAALSTPRAAVAGRAMNPLVRRSLEDLLTSAAAEQFLGQAGLGDVGSGSDGSWERGPTFVASRDGRLLDRSVTIESFAGIRSGEPRSVAFVHLARAETDDVVLAGAVHGRPIETDRETFVGTEGYLPREAFEEAAETFAETIERLDVSE